MKPVLFLTILFATVIVFGSCKKTFNCICTNTSYDSTTIIGVDYDTLELSATKRKDAEAACSTGSHSELDPVHGGSVTKCALQ